MNRGRADTCNQPLRTIPEIEIGPEVHAPREGKGDTLDNVHLTPIPWSVD
jgi:hypothetical protein